MSEEKVNETTQAPKKKHWPIVISVLAVIVIAVFVAFLHWHESPSFCNVFCHQPMDRYVEGYYSEDESLSVANHAAADVTCLGCHWSQAKMMDLVHEVTLWVTDGFTDPLEDKTEIASDAFCGACHDGETAPSKEEATADLAFDPHNIPEGVVEHEGIECSSCHKVHKQSIMACAACHADAATPENWATPAKSDGLVYAAETYGLYDPHALVGTEMFESLSEFHATAGANGAIACSDCHSANLAESAPSTTPNVLMCAKCHSDVFNADNAPEGWTVPEDAKAATAAMGIYDPHALVGTEMFESLTTFHATAGADGGAIACADCHDTNTFKCAQCHSEAYEGLIPDGWTVPEDARAALAEEYGMLDPHTLITLDAFKEAAFHQGGVDGTYSCLDCHTESGENVFVCAQCHAGDFADLTAGLAEKGWTIPEGMDVPMMGEAA